MPYASVDTESSAVDDESNVREYPTGTAYDLVIYNITIHQQNYYHYNINIHQNYYYYYY